MLPASSDLAPAPYLVDPAEGPVEVEVPDLGTLVDGPVEDELPDLASTFSAVRSIVTGRLEPVVEEEDALPGLSVGPFPPPEDVPPEDFLSVAIYSPPEPAGSKTFTIHASLRSGSAAPKLFARCNITTPPVLVNNLLTQDREVSAGKPPLQHEHSCI